MGILRVSAKLGLVVGLGLAAAACQDDGNGAPRGYRPAPANYNNGNYSPPPSSNYANNQQRNRNSYYEGGRRYTTVTVTNRGQNGYADDVVQQKVLCGSQYYDGYRQRIARC